MTNLKWIYSKYLETNELTTKYYLLFPLLSTINWGILSEIGATSNSAHFMSAVIHVWLKDPVVTMYSDMKYTHICICTFSLLDEAEDFYKIVNAEGHYFYFLS
jgi:hypothetical protein